MKVTHRGHTIEVKHERSLGGDILLYLVIFRDSDGFLCVDEPYFGAETAREMVRYMKERVDAELQEDDPWEEEFDTR